MMRNFSATLRRFCADRFATSGSGNPKDLGDKSHYVRHMLGYMTTDDFVEFIVCKRIRENTQIVDYVGVGSGV